MEKNILAAARRVCISAGIALLILSSCSNKAKTSDSEGKRNEGTAVSMPIGAIPLSAVLQAVENAGYTPVVEVEFEKDHWKIKAHKDGQLLQLKVGLMKGEILPDPASTLEKPLSL